MTIEEFRRLFEWWGPVLKMLRNRRLAPLFEASVFAGFATRQRGISMLGHSSQPNACFVRFSQRSIGTLTVMVKRRSDPDSITELLLKVTKSEVIVTEPPALDALPTALSSSSSVVLSARGGASAHHPAHYSASPQHTAAARSLGGGLSCQSAPSVATNPTTMRSYPSVRAAFTEHPVLSEAFHFVGVTDDVTHAAMAAAQVADPHTTRLSQRHARNDSI